MNIREEIRKRVTRRKSQASPNKSQGKRESQGKSQTRRVPPSLRHIITNRKQINQLPKYPIMRLNIEREFNLHIGLMNLCSKYSPKRIMDWYWSPNYIKNGLPITPDMNDPEFEHDLKMVHQSLLPNHIKPSVQLLNEFVQAVEERTDLIIKKYPALKKINELERYALFRYWTVGALNNISLSVSPEKKQEWGINFELFGAFYNTNTPYCGLYPELESRCCCDVLHFYLQPNMNILVNPPYTEKWIQTACELVSQYLEMNMNTTIWLVVPIWNTANRLIEGLKPQDDMPILDLLKDSPYLIKHEITKLPFYNGLTKKRVYLNDKVHVYHFSNVNKQKSNISL